MEEYKFFLQVTTNPLEEETWTSNKQMRIRVSIGIMTNGRSKEDSD